MQLLRACGERTVNERGVALILTLVMLVVLGLLGALSLSTSSTELHIAGNYRNAQIAFYNADVIEGYGPNNVTVLSSIKPYVVNSYPSGTTGYQTVTMPSGAAGSTRVRVTFLCASLPTAGMKLDQEIFLAYHFLVTTVGKGYNNSEFVSESEVVQIGPRPSGMEPDC